jgi:hypothetical protein
MIRNRNPRSPGVSRVRCSGYVQTSWQNLRFAFGKSELLRLNEQLSDCKHITSQYIEKSPDMDTARHAVLILAANNHLYMPTHINDSSILRTVLQYWLSLGYDINKEDSSGYTLLQYECTLPYPDLAAYPGRIAYLSLLIDYGADVHSLHHDKYRGTLHLVMNAVALRLVSTYWIGEVEETLVLLLEAGCDPYNRDSDGKTPSDYTDPEVGGKWNERHRKLGNAAWENAMARTSNIRRILTGDWQARACYDLVF